MRVPVKRYWIQLRGFDGHMVEAETASKARFATFTAWKDAGYGHRYTFRDFLDRIEVFHHHGRLSPPR